MVEYWGFVRRLGVATTMWAATIQFTGTPALARRIASGHLAHDSPQGEAEDARHGEKDDAGERDY